MCMQRSAKLQNAIGLYMEGIRDGRPREAVAKYTGARYTQHSTGVADGQAGFIAFFEDFLQRCPKREIEVVRAIEDGRYVFCQAAQNLNDGASRWITTDLFDTDDDDKIIEHWDVISEWRDDTADGRSQLGGSAEVQDLSRTSENKALVQHFVEAVLIGGAHERMTEFVADDLEQHDLSLGNGVSAWREALASTRTRYRDLFRLIGQGNFVVTYCEVDVAGASHAVFDVYRLAEGRIVERWTNREIVPEDTGNSGKF